VSPDRSKPKAAAPPPRAPAAGGSPGADGPPGLPAAKRARVLVVDDHPFFRSGVISWLERQAGLAPCGEAGTVFETREAVEALRPDIVLMDHRLTEGDGLDLLRELIDRHPAVRIIVLSQADEDVFAHRAGRAGARGYVMKSEATDVLLAAIQTVLRGGLHLSRRAAARMMQNLFPDPAGAGSDLARLSDRELQVFQLLGAGSGVTEIADSLKISPRTVETHRERLKAKLGVLDAAALLRLATIWVEQGRMVNVRTSGSA